MINIYDTLKIWHLSLQEGSVPLSHTKVLNELECLVPEHSGQELLNLLRTENLVSANIHGDYVLTQKGIFWRKQIPDVARVKVKKKTGHEWERFRKILGYYMDCVHCQEKSQHYLFENDLNQKYFVPILPFGWLKGLGQTSEFKITIPSESRIAHRQLLSRSDEDEDVYIGYPVTAFRTAASNGTCYSPVGLIPVDILDTGSETTMSVRLRLDEAEINQQWLEYNLPRDDRNVFINSILQLHSHDEFRGMIDLLLALPFFSHWEPDYLNPDHLELILPKLKIRESRTLCNAPVLFVGNSLQYSKTLKKELKYIRECPDEVLDKTALAYIFREPALECSPNETQFMPLPFIANNIEQMAAVETALNEPVTKITGPPGTGKSQVAVNIIANLIYNGKSALFTSKNHKAVLAIASRSHALLEQYGLDLVTFCTNEDKTLANPWFKQDIDELINQATCLADSIDSESVSHIADAVSRWQDIEGHFSRRNEVLHPYTERQRKNLDLIKELQRLFPKETNAYSLPEIQLLKMHISNVRDEPVLRLHTVFTWLLWKYYRKKKNDEALGYLHSHYPEVFRKVVDLKGLKKRFTEFYAVFSEYMKNQKELTALEEKAIELPTVTFGKEHLSDCLEEIKDHLIPAFVYKRCIKIQELITHPEIIDKLKNIMSILQGAKSPFFFQRLESDVFQEAKEGFKLFQTYFPSWATTLLSLTKASPCIPALFDSIIVDEASQCDIASVIPAFFRAKNAVLIGDPNQFPPVQTLKELRNDYLKSKHELIELNDQKYDFLKYSAYDLPNKFPVLLREHFRCTADIAAFFNDEFYAGQLCIRSDEHEMKFPSCMGYKRGIEWIDIYNSMENELDAVKKTLETLVRNQYPGTIGVVTPFREYADILNERLYSAVRKRPDILINTANAFQGGERDVMIFVLCYNDQLTQGQKWYAEAQENRYIYNVAVSRAKACLIIIGDKSKCQKSGIRVLQKLSLLPLAPTTSNIDQYGGTFDSPWEKRFYQALSNAGIKSLPQYPLMGRRLDLAVICGSLKIDIEIDGVHWHTSQDGRRKLDDIFRDLQVGGAGWIVQRFWVYELQNDIQGCVEKIKMLLKNADGQCQEPH